MGQTMVLTIAITRYLCSILLYQVIFHVTPVAMAEHRVVNGTDVNPPHKYPWMVSLYIAGRLSDGEYPRTPSHICGGAVLNEYYVLTAAHCCYADQSNPNNVTAPGVLFVLTGLHEREQLKPWSQNLSIAECIVHELYVAEPTLHNDIGLIRVTEKIQFSDKVTPLNLPPYDFDVDTDGEVTVILMGWGFLKDFNRDEFVPKVLQQVELPVITTETCQIRHGHVFYHGKNRSDSVTDSMLCTGFLEGGKGGCYFDSGSPVVLLNPKTKTYTQMGIVSWAVAPCAATYTVNVRVSAYTRWIQHHLQKCKPRKLEASA